jgi:hypothetical protein
MMASRVRLERATRPSSAAGSDDAGADGAIAPGVRVVGVDGTV